MPSFTAKLVLPTIALLATLASSQTLLTFGGTGGLPTCAEQCTTLTSAQTACVPPAVPDTDTTAYWACFCGSTGLDPLWQSSSAAFCTECDTADQASIVSWFGTNCGSDNGVSEHQGTSTTAAAAATSAASTTSSLATSAASNTAASGTTSTGADDVETGSWWSNHWKWIVMVIVIVFGFLLVALIGVLLKRRYERKRDLPTTSFNEGITTRATPAPDSTRSRNVASGGYETGEARDTPSRTREAFMPYGYSYSRSENRLASRSGARTPGDDMEKQSVATVTPTSKPRGILSKGKQAQLQAGDGDEIEKVG